MTKVLKQLVRIEYFGAIFVRRNMYEIVSVILKLLSKGLGDTIVGKKLIETAR